MLRVSQCTIFGNSAHGRDAASGGDGGGGGGIFARITAVVEDSTIHANAGVGGGIGGGSVIVANSTVSDNNGAGIRAKFSANVTASTVSGNIGSGIEADLVSLTNTTVSGNTGIEGGGIHLLSLNLGSTIVNSTITNNFAYNAGGGVFYDPASIFPVVFQNSIVAGNFVGLGNPGPDVFGKFQSEGHNLIGIVDGATGFTPGANGDLLGTLSNPRDPMLGPLQDNGGPTWTHALLAGSPAIDHADNAVLDPTGLAVTTDQRGHKRSRGGNRDGVKTVDIGASER